METVWSSEADKILKVGYRLDEVGVRNWALTRSDALTALERLLVSRIPILGGDVYEDIDGIIQSNGDGWYCDSVSGETRNDFVVRSIAKTKTYIEAYKVTRTDKVLFAFVPDV